MIIIFGITAFVILLYLGYPLWLGSIARGKPLADGETAEISSVSVILLSFNGKKYLEDKIGFLMDELSGFENHELIIIDDGSTDGSSGLLERYVGLPSIKVFLHDHQEGIPYSMNFGMANASYDHVIFCDQRQELSSNCIRRILDPLKYEETGAVSGCISRFDTHGRCSLIRMHENYLKSKESVTGNLIGVYGPFYAIKKECYSQIPGHIILDDLYLSLKILRSKRVVLASCCLITDDNLSDLYDYSRTRRYLTGLMQILKDHSVTRDLDSNQKIMLIWHKYLRLVIPMMLSLCYLALGSRISEGAGYLISFVAVTILAMVAVFFSGARFRMKNLVRMNVFYFLATVEIVVNRVSGGRRRPGKNVVPGVLHENTADLS